MRRNRGDSDSHSSHSSNHQDIPFRDADPSTGEVPLDQLDTFIIPARDDKGITQSIQFNVPPYLERVIEVVIRSGRFPYLNLGSFFRHAGVRHVRYLTEIRRSLPQHLFSSLEALSEVCRENEMRLRVEEAFENINTQINRHKIRGDVVEALRLMTVVKSRIEQAHSSSWQRRFYADFLRMHEALLNSDGSVKTVDQLRQERVIQSLDH